MIVDQSDKRKSDMRILAGCTAFFLLSCTATTPRPGAAEADSTNPAPTLPPPGAPSAPAAFRENLSMVGAVLVAIEMVDETRYVLTLELRTVLPAGTAGSLAEPGQTVTVYPDYVVGEDGRISLEHERNGRLYEVRHVKPGDGVIGRITLRRDGKWYLFDTGLE